MVRMRSFFVSRSLSFMNVKDASFESYYLFLETLNHLLDLVECGKINN